MEQRTSAWEAIDPSQRLSKKEFLTLFENLPLLADEKSRLEKEYFGVYEKFIDSGVDAQTSWLAARNLFTNKEKQIGERIK